MAGGQGELLSQKLAGFVNETAIVADVEIQINIPSERGILVPDHRGAFGEGNLGEFSQWNLSVRRRRDYDTLYFLQVIPKIRRVADIYRIAFTAFDVLSNVFAANPGGDCALHVADGESVARGF